MSLFRKKRKTETTTSVNEQSLQKIIKLSYIQSLALSGGIIDTKSLLETSATSTTTDLGNSNSENLIEKQIVDRFGVGGSHLVGGTIGSLIGGSLGSVLGTFAALFGKKVEKSGNIKIEDSGWQLVKTWNQPEFDLLRYAIGIKDLAISTFTYVNVSEVVSTPWVSPKEILKVTLTVDQFIPNNFPPGVYIEYYIKPDTKDADWIRINSLNSSTQYKEDGTIVPRIITFNTEKPISSRIEESYITTKEPVKSIRFRALLKRPESLEGYSPILKSYRLSFSLRNGL